MINNNCFILLFIYVFIHLCVSVHARVCVPVYLYIHMSQYNVEIKGQLLRISYFFLLDVSWEQTQVTSLNEKHFFLIH